MRRATLLLVCLLVSSALRAGTPLPGFQETVFVPSIFSLTGFEWAPNGDFWIISKGGLVRVIRAGTTNPVVVVNLHPDQAGERGLLGLEFDPNFTANQYLYLYYTVPGPPPFNRVSRFTVTGNSLANELILFEGPALVADIHNAGCIGFGTDGMLYIAMGDNNDPPKAQDLSSPLGKILRIKPDGGIPSDNPFVADPNAHPAVWLSGFRNPYRFTVDRRTGNIYVGDVGQASWEELNLAIPGGNYGWPLTEGPNPPGIPGIIYPYFTYDHGVLNSAIIPGDFMVPGNFPAQYTGDFFYADYARGKIYRIVFDANGQVASNTQFVNQAPGVAHIRVGPDGALYYGSNNFQTIWRLSYVGGANTQPSAVATALPTDGLAPLDVQLDGSRSTDPDGTPLTYDWAFGDGQRGTQPIPTHRYMNPGSYNATLTVSDGQLTSNTTLRIVAGNRAPTGTILTPPNGVSYNAGDTIVFSGEGFDPEEGALPATGLTWSVVFHHQQHIHPFLGPFSGLSSGSFVIPVNGEASHEVWYEVRLTAADTGAPVGTAALLSDTRSINVLPNVSTMTFKATPRSDLSLTLDGQPVIGPASVPGVVGVQRILGAASPQTPGDGFIYTFLRWSDGGAREHAIRTPATSTTWTAVYQCGPEEPLTVPYPSAVGNSLTVTNGSGTANLTWDDEGNAGPFRVYRGFRRTGRPWSYTHTCLESSLPGASATDAQPPPPNTLFYYLVTRGVCLESFAGRDSAGRLVPNPDRCPGTMADADGDGVDEAIDTCAGLYNPSQADADDDQHGDECDNCPGDSNAHQEDLDADGLGDVCDPDLDGDGVDNATDNCPHHPNPGQQDADSDGVGDACDT